jgi:dTMP kinase
LKYKNFIVFEGLDKAGKSTLIKKVQNELTEKGINVATLHFPTENNNPTNIFGNLVQDFLQNKIYTNQQELIYHIYANDRLEQKSNLENLLSEHDIVLCDRYMYSNLAYMGVKMQKEMDYMVKYGYNLEFKINQIPEPELIFFLDTKEDILTARYEQEKDTADVLEKDRRLQKKARQNYLELENLIENYYVLSDNDTKRIINKIKKILN